MFAIEQQSRIPIDIYVYKACAVLAQLPDDTLSKGVHLDIIHGLSHKKVPDKMQHHRGILINFYTQQE